MSEENDNKRIVVYYAGEVLCYLAPEASKLTDKQLEIMMMHFIEQTMCSKCKKVALNAVVMYRKYAHEYVITDIVSVDGEHALELNICV
jgi:hypothetical protein